MAAGGDWVPKIDRLAVWALRAALAPLRALAAGCLWLNARDRADTPTLPAPRWPEWEKIAPAWRWLIVAPATLVCVAAVALAIWLFLAAAIDAVSGDPEPRAMQIALPIVAAVVGAPFVAWRTILAAQQTHFTDLFTKAVALLGADKVEEVYTLDGGDPTIRVQAKRTVPNIEVRLGAIYALERIMKQSPDDCWPIRLLAHRQHPLRLCAAERDTRQEPTDEEETAAARAARLEAIKARVAALGSGRAAARGGGGARRAEPRAPRHPRCADGGREPGSAATDGARGGDRCGRPAGVAEATRRPSTGAPRRATRADPHPSRCAERVGRGVAPRRPCDRRTAGGRAPRAGTPAGGTHRGADGGGGPQRGVARLRPGQRRPSCRLAACRSESNGL